MKNKNTIWWIVGILLLIGIIYWVYRQGYFAKYGFGTMRINSPGEESVCNDTGNDPEGRSSAKVSGCFPPVAPQLYLVFQGGPKGNVKEKEWTSEEVKGIKDILDDYTPDWNKPTKINVRDSRGQYVDWTFNQKRVDPSNGTEYYLFVDNPSYRNYKEYPKA